MTLAGKIVRVTGGTGALGSVVSRAFLDEGASVEASYIEDREMARLAAEIKQHPQFQASKVNLTEEAAVKAWFADTEQIDVLVNVAGGFAMAPFVETSWRDWRHLQDMNLNTVFLACREALARMDGRRGGRIINIAAYAASLNTGGMAAYTTSKAGVIHLTRALAEETLAGKITVNAILPTIMDTPANRANMPDADFSQWVPLEQVAQTILFLASENAWPITGACIPLRGHC